jgi:hypothetical protein
MGAPGQLITKALAIELNQNYISKRSNVISAAIGYDDANAIWYSIEELENYITYVKAEAGSIGYVAEGIRLYFGVYENKPEYGDLAGMTNVFLCPTGYEEGGAPSKSDIAEIQPMNMGTIGNPPIIDYPSI